MTYALAKLRWRHRPMDSSIFFATGTMSLTRNAGPVAIF
jgi:hypothetical protein